MNKDDKNIDKLLRDRFQDFGKNPSPHLWSKIEKKVAVKPHGNMIFFNSLLLVVMSSGLLLAGWSYIYFNNIYIKEEQALHNKKKDKIYENNGKNENDPTDINSTSLKFNDSSKSKNETSVDILYQNKNSDNLNVKEKNILNNKSNINPRQTQSVSDPNKEVKQNQRSKERSPSVNTNLLGITGQNIKNKNNSTIGKGNEQSRKNIAVLEKQLNDKSFTKETLSSKKAIHNNQLENSDLTAERKISSNLPQANRNKNESKTGSNIGLKEETQQNVSSLGQNNFDKPSLGNNKTAVLNTTMNASEQQSSADKTNNNGFAKEQINKNLDTNTFSRSPITPTSSLEKNNLNNSDEVMKNISQNNNNTQKGDILAFDSSSNNLSRHPNNTNVDKNNELNKNSAYEFSLSVDSSLNSENKHKTSSSNINNAMGSRQNQYKNFDSTITSKTQPISSLDKTNINVTGRDTVSDKYSEPYQNKGNILNKENIETPDSTIKKEKSEENKTINLKAAKEFFKRASNIKKGNLSLGIYFSPEIFFACKDCYLAGSYKSKPSYSGGLILNHQISDKISVSLGASILNLKKKISYSYSKAVFAGMDSTLIDTITHSFTYTTRYKNTEIKINASNHYTYLGIPIQINYKISEKRVYLTATLGITPVFLVSVKETVFHPGDSTGTMSNDDLKKFNLQLSGGLGFNYELSGKVTLFMEPTMRYFALKTRKTRDYGIYHPLILGLQTGLRIKF